MAREPFIYTNPAAGQQAVQYEQMKTQADMAREARINDLYQQLGRNLTASGASAGANATQREISRGEMARRETGDVERKRQFDESLKLERDRLDAAKTSQATAIETAQKAKDAEYDRQAAMWEETAAALNARPPKPGQKIPNGIVLDPKTGKYVPLMKRRPASFATPPNGDEQLAEIQARRAQNRGLVVPPAGAPAVQPPTQTGLSVPVPSPGGFTPRDTDFRVPVEYPGGPQVQDGYEGRFMTVPQQEITDAADVRDYEYSSRQPRPTEYDQPRFALPPEEFIPTFDPPRRRSPGAYLPY